MFVFFYNPIAKIARQKGASKHGLAIRFFMLMAILIGSNALFSQAKSEHEWRVKKKEVPDDAREWLSDAFEGFKRVKWYQEESDSGSSFEAKFNWTGRKMSVKFDTTGVVIDVEYIISFSEIPITPRNNLFIWFEENYSRYRIMKIQQQILGSPDALEDYFDEDELGDIIFNYEIEFYGEKDSESEVWEALFNVTGGLINIRRVELPPTFNLEY